MGKRFDGIKAHFRAHKTEYVVGCGCLVVGVVGTTLLVGPKTPSQITQSLSWKPRAEIRSTTIHLAEKSTPSKPVHLVGTDLYFDSLSAASRATGHALSAISQQVNGHRADVNGDVFELLQPP